MLIEAVLQLGDWPSYFFSTFDAAIFFVAVLFNSHNISLTRCDPLPGSGLGLGLVQALGEGGRVERDMAALTLVVGLGMEGGRLQSGRPDMGPAM